MANEIEAAIIGASALVAATAFQMFKLSFKRRTRNQNYAGLYGKWEGTVTQEGVEDTDLPQLSKLDQRELKAKV